MNAKCSIAYTNSKIQTRFSGAMKAVEIKSNYVFYHIYITFFLFNRKNERNMCGAFFYASCRMLFILK